MAMQSIGVRLGILGTADYIDQLKKAVQETKKFGEEVKNASKLDNPFAKFSGMSDALSKEIESQKKVIEGYTQQVERWGEESGENAAHTERWRVELTKATGELKTMEDQLKDISSAKFELPNMEAAVSAFKAEYERVSSQKIGVFDFSGALAKASEAQTWMKQQIDAQKEVVSLLESEYRKAADAQGEFSTGAYEMREKLADARAELNEMQEDLKKLPGAMGAVGDLSSRIGDGLLSVSKATAPITAGVTGALTGIIKVSADYEQQMSAVKAVMNATDEEMSAIDAKAREVARSTVFDATEIGTAFEQLGRGGKNANESIAMVDAAVSLAAADNMSMADSAQTLITIMNSLHMPVDDAQRVVDLYAQVSRNSSTNTYEMAEAAKYAAPSFGALGWEIEDMGLALGMAADYGVKGSQAGTGLRQALKNLEAGSEPVIQAMEKYGITLDDGTGKAKSFDEFLGDLRSTFGDVTESIDETSLSTMDGEEIMEAYGDSLPNDQLEKLKAISDIFGTRALPTMLALIKTGEGDFLDLKDAIENCDGAASEMAEEMLNNTKGDWELFIDQVKDLALEFGDVLLPVLRDLIGTAKDFVAGFSGMSEGQRKFIIMAGLTVGAISPVTGALGGTLKGIGSLLKGGDKLIRFFTGAGGVTEAASTVAGAKGLGSIVTAIGGGASGLIGAIGSAASAFAPFLLPAGLIVGAVALGMAAIKNNWLGLGDAFDSLKGWLGETKDKFLEFVGVTTEESKKAKEDTGRTLSDLRNQAKTDFGEIGDASADMNETVTRNSREMAQSIEEWMVPISSTVETTMSDVREATNAGFGAMPGIAEENLAETERIVAGNMSDIRAATNAGFGAIPYDAEESLSGLRETTSTSFDEVEQEISASSETIRDDVNAIWQEVSEATREAWGNDISNAITEGWHSVMESMNEELTGMNENVSAAYAEIAQAVGDELDSLKTDAKRNWEEIADVSVTAIDAAGQKVSAQTQNLRRVLGDNWAGMNAEAGKKWDELKSTIEDTVTQIGEDTDRQFTEIKENTENIFDETGLTVQDRATEIRETIAEKFREAKEKAVEEVLNMRDTVGDIMTETADRARGWGYDIGESIADGINRSIPLVADAARDAARTIKDYLGFSEPEKGPLSDFHTYMPDMMRLMASGIYGSMGLLSRASEAIAETLVPEVYLPDFRDLPANGTGTAGTTVQYGDVHIEIYGAEGQDVNEIAEAVSERLAFMTGRARAVYA